MFSFNIFNRFFNVGLFSPEILLRVEVWLGTWRKKKSALLKKLERGMGTIIFELYAQLVVPYRTVSA